MSEPAAKEGDKVAATDTHMVIPASGGPPVPTPMPFSGPLSSNLSPNVIIEHLHAATEGSVANNTPSHIAVGGSFQKPPSNKGTVQSGSGTVLINGKQAARNADPAVTCNDPVDLAIGTVVAKSTVLMGG